MANSPLSKQRQVKEGIDAVIVDSVLAIRKGLTDASSEVLTPPMEIEKRLVTGQTEIAA